jgi:hypothetical protein
MDTDKIKKFFVHHFEKMILVVVIGAAGFLVFQGYQLPDFLDKEQPERLTTEATRVKGAIDENHNDAIIPERQPTFDILAETKKLYTPVDSSPYKPPYLWDPSRKEGAIVRRQDPTISPPRSLVLTGVATAIAVRGSTTDKQAYALASLEGAEPLEKVEPPKVRQPRPRRGRGMDDMEMMDMMDMMGMGMEPDMSMEMDMSSAMGMTQGTGPTRKFNSKFDFGFRPIVTDDKRNPEPAIGWFIAGTAVVPHKEMYEAFELALSDAEQYNPRRDTPFYFNLEVQRADVTDKPVEQLQEADWTKNVQTKGQALWDRDLYTKLAAFRWSGFAPEVVPADYRDEALTLWIPPILLDDYRGFVGHPLVPKLSQAELKKLANAGVEEEELPEFDPMGMEDVGLLAPGAAPGTGMSMEMMDSSMGMDMMDMEMDMMGDMGGMMMGMSMSMMGRSIEVDPVDYKLIRFYDFAGFKNSPQPGRKYVYRIRYSVNDPNFPFSQLLQPAPNSLSPEVLARVQALMAKAKESGLRDFQRWSDWSEPSAPISLPSLEHYYAGPVTRGTINTWQVKGKDVEYARDLPVAKIVTSQYDPATGARIPFRLDVTEGSVLSHRAESADVVDPITLDVKKLPDVDLVSETTVVDIDGGRTLAMDPTLTEPGLMLLYDQTGQLKVSNEVADQEFYRIYSYADDRGE